MPPPDPSPPPDDAFVDRAGADAGCAEGASPADAAVEAAEEVEARSGEAVPAVPDEAVRLALELAFGVAVLGSRHRPPLPVPAGLRPFLRFQKLPGAALGPLRRAVEADAAFRERVAAVADESVVGRAGSLWLRRPEGWERALAEEVAALAAASAGADRRDRDEAVRIERAERAAARASAELAVATEALAAERERAAAREAERAAVGGDLGRLERSLEELRLQVEVAQRRATDADRSRREADARAAALEARLNAARDEREALAGELEAARRDLEVARAAAERPVAVAPERAPDDLARRLAPLVDEAAGAIAGLARALQRIGAELDDRAAPGGRRAAGAAPSAPTAHRPGPGGPAPGGVGPAAVPARPGPVPRPAPRPAGPAREAVALPPRVRADSTEAATYLLRRPGAAVMVDGYNVAKTAFPGARTLADERDWMGDVLDELAARLGADLRVVYDGADVPPVPSRRRAVQVLFSPAGVTADDVLVDLTCSLPVERPVVVVTNDLALRERVKVYGANVIGAEQLLAVARR